VCVCVHAHTSSESFSTLAYVYKTKRTFVILCMTSKNTWHSFYTFVYKSHVNGVILSIDHSLIYLNMARKTLKNVHTYTRQRQRQLDIYIYLYTMIICSVPCSKIDINTCRLWLRLHKRLHDVTSYVENVWQYEKKRKQT